MLVIRLARDPAMFLTPSTRRRTGGRPSRPSTGIVGESPTRGRRRDACAPLLPAQSQAGRLALWRRRSPDPFVLLPLLLQTPLFLLDPLDELVGIPQSALEVQG